MWNIFPVTDYDLNKFSVVTDFRCHGSLKGLFPVKLNLKVEYDHSISFSCQIEPVL